ncbi:MAG: hypothetical protein GXP31_11760 [Kiritimatiellaeota bacterium]|nr:hypothetical protein [Kiritimatiellota bacterium]
MPTADVYPITFWAMHYWRGKPEYEKIISDEQYRLIKQCNFNLVMGGPLDKAQRFGLQCMSDALPWTYMRNLWWTPDKPVSEAQRDKIRALLGRVDRKNPALWGYHLCDEPGTKLYPKIKEVLAIIRSVDPDHPVFINLHPGSDLLRFAREVTPDLLAYDHYPVFEDGAPLDGSIPPGFDNANFRVDLARGRRAALASGLRFIPTMLSSGHYLDYEVKGVKYHRSYGHITEARLRWQAYSALAYNAGGIAWFLYFTSPRDTYEEAAIGRDWRPTQKYYWLKKLNREVGAIGVILRGLRSVGTYESRPFYCYKGRRAEDLTPFGDKGFITGVEGGLVTAGEFTGENGMRYLILVNRNVNESVRITPRLRWGSIGTVDVFDREKLSWRVLSGPPTDAVPLRVELAPGDGIFLRLNPR